MSKTQVIFKYVAYMEGISLLLLLGIAMPVKYLLGDPRMVAKVGMAHGLLFMLYIVVLIYVAVQWQWGIKKVLLGVLASILPFGPFWFHKKYVDDLSDSGSGDKESLGS